MPHLIDGNNLMHAIGSSVGRESLCALLADLPTDQHPVCVVFDGPSPPAGVARQIEQFDVEVVYAAPKDADTILLMRIANNSAPRRLTVVSTDRQIRQAARRRRCQSVRSEDFAKTLLRTPRTGPNVPPEPAEKQDGLAPHQTREWLREFGFDPLDDSQDKT